MTTPTFLHRELLKPREVMLFFRISRSTFYRWVESGNLKAKRINGVIRIPREELQRLQQDYAGLEKGVPSVLIRPGSPDLP